MKSEEALATPQDAAKRAIVTVHEVETRHFPTGDPVDIGVLFYRLHEGGHIWWSPIDKEALPSFVDVKFGDRLIVTLTPANHVSKAERLPSTDDLVAEREHLREKTREALSILTSLPNHLRANYQVQSAVEALRGALGQPTRCLSKEVINGGPQGTDWVQCDKPAGHGTGINGTAAKKSHLFVYKEGLLKGSRVEWL